MTRRRDGNRTFKHKKSTVSAGLLWHQHSPIPELWAQESLYDRVLTIGLGEKLRERLDHLEAVAASAALSHTTEGPPAAGTGPSRAVITHSSSSTPPYVIAQSLPAYDAPDVSVSTSSTATPEEYQHLIPQSDDTPLALSIRDSTTHVDPSLLFRDKHNDDLDPYLTTTINDHCSSPQVQFGPNATAADPHANNLRIETACITAALYTLGLHMGITEEILCADESLSPFFWSGAESANDIVKASIVCTVQSTFKTLKPDLRPSSEQITVKHHPFIDILPFPTLRKNLITHQEVIDEDEFFHDMLTGLVCWGGAGIGRKDREDSTGNASTGTPWDVRSWEARVWFLKKYWTLLGREDGELVRQSVWWRSIRGEDTLDMEVHS